MLTRRLLRIKTFQTLYAYSEQPDAPSHTFERFLLNSIDTAYDYYLFLLQLPGELTYYIENEFNPVTRKYLPTSDDERTVKAFSGNSAVKMLSESKTLLERIKGLSYNWHQHKDFLQAIVNNLRNTDQFRAYIRQDQHSFGEQQQFLAYFYSEFLFRSEFFNQMMEEINLHWNDDMISISKAVAKTVASISSPETEVNIQAFSNNLDEDIEFAKTLFKRTLNKGEELEGLISRRTKNWDKERIAITDFILLKMAVCEMLEFPYVPVKVTINEYLEIAKSYSTPNSSKFLNGVLDKILADLRAEGRIVKLGRGLME